MDDAPSETTRLLNGLVRGDPSVTDEVVANIQGELKRLAARHMLDQPREHTLQPTALVNEVWVRMFGREGLEFEGRKQFFRFASRVMRSVLVDHGRAKQADKRRADGGRLSLSFLDGEPDRAAGVDVDVLDLDDALQRLEDVDPELARLVELRFFGGLSSPEVAEVLDSSLRTVERRWRLARAWLFQELSM